MKIDWWSGSPEPVLRLAKPVRENAWGKRRFASGADDPTGSITSLTTRGFTGQEELSVASLVHLNGRVYDPVLGRMLSADPTVPDALNAQAWNRYSYVANDPLAFTDPSGYSWLSQFFHGVVHFFQTNPLLRAIAQIALTAVLAPLGPIVAMVTAAAASSAIVTGLSGGHLGAILRNAVIAGATALAFNFVGDITLGPAHAAPDFLSEAHIENIAGHPAVGCGAALARHESCGAGALSAAVGALSGPILPTQDFTARLVITAALGGTASVATGGSFANGAVTAAFGEMFNGMAGRAVGGIVGGAIFGAAGVETGPLDALLIAAGHYLGGEIGSRIEDLFSSTNEPTTVIGRSSDLQNLGPDEQSLLSRLPNQGNPQDNWEQNAGVLRQQMSRSLPIRDASPGDIRGVFLNAERNLLLDRGWTFNRQTNFWMPP